jgi:DNA-binding LytR/AlgR family response regulator
MDLERVPTSEFQKFINMNQIKRSPLRCVVIEDEPDFCQWLCERLSEFPDVEIVGSKSDIDGAFDLITQTKPDGIFLDVKLIGGTAFNLIDRLQKNLTAIPPIAMITGNVEYAPSVINQYRGSIVKYLVKPFVRDYKTKLQLCIDAFIEHKKNALLSVILKSDGGLRRLQIEELHYLEVGGSGRTYFITQTGTFIVDMTLTKILELLPSSVVQCNRNYAINLQKVIFMDAQTAKLVIDGKEKTFKITETFTDAIRQAFVQMV